MLKMNDRERLGNFEEQQYISFGPSCISAEILKACNLRFCTFGFDWFRSGSFHHSLFFRMNLKDFLNFQVNNISIPLRQTENPEKLSNITSEYSELKQLYGYNVLYNPHRAYNKNSFRYYKRAFERLALRLNKNKKEFKEPTLLMADYLNKNHYIYFNDTGKAAAYLRYNCLLRFNYMPRVKIVRFKLVEDEALYNESLLEIAKEHHMEYTIPLSHSIDKDTRIRRMFYKSLSDIFS